MDGGDVIGSLVSGGASLIGGAMTNAANVNLMNQQNQFNRDEAATSRAWQTDMSNTQYQRSMADMKAAGLNPMLAYMKGGAGTPGGATASAASTPTMQNNVGQAVSSAFDRYQQAKQNAQVDADIDNKRTQNLVLAATADKETANAKVAKANAEAIQSQLPAIKKRADYDNKFGDFDAYNQRAATAAGTITNALTAGGKGLGGLIRGLFSKGGANPNSGAREIELDHNVFSAGRSGIPTE